MTAKKVDKNQPRLVKKFRELGATVFHLHTVGAGCPDLLVGLHGHNFICEVKDEIGHLTKAQVDFHSTWAGLVWIARTEDDVEKIVKFYSDLVPLHALENVSNHIDSPPVS